MTTRGKTLNLITAGAVVDLGDPPGSTWSIPAADVREYCADQIPGRAPDTPVRLRKAQITGELDLSELNIGRPLCFSACEFAAVNLSGLRTTQPIVFDHGTSMWALTAEDLISATDLVIKDCLVVGPVSLGRARIGGALQLTGSNLSRMGLESARVGADLDCSEARVTAFGDVCVNGKHLQVDGEIILTERSHAEGEVNLQWAHARSLRATGAQLRNPGGCALRADGFHALDDIFLDYGFRAEGAVTLVGARLGDELRCTDGVFKNQSKATEANLQGRCLDAERVEANDVLLDRGFKAHGEVRLVGAQLETQHNCTDGSFHHEGAEYALNADDLLANGDVFLNEMFEADGEVRLVGAKIGRELNCTGGCFREPGGIALNADGMTTEGSVFLNSEKQRGRARRRKRGGSRRQSQGDGEGTSRKSPRGFESVGQVRFARATVGRQLDCVGGRFVDAASRQPVLDLTGVVGKGDVLLRDATVTGGVSLAGACIDRDLDCQNTALSSRDSGPALHAAGLRVDGTLIWKPGSCAGTVNLEFAHTGLLDDDLQRWPRSSGPGKPAKTRFSGGYELTGFTYEELADPRGDREDWLKGTRDFSPLPWHQLASYYRRTGREQEARETIIASHKDSRKRAGLTWQAKSWDWFIGVTTGFGYRLYRPFLGVLILWAIGIVAFYFAQVEDVMHATRSSEAATLTAGKCTADYPCFVFWLYPLELLMPVLGLWLVGYWLPSPDDALGWFYLLFSLFYIVAGWVLGIAVVAGIRHLLKTD